MAAKLPKAVQAQLDEVEKLMSPQPAAEETPAAVPDPVAVEPPVTAPEPVATPAQPEPTEDWEQKYKVLEGKYRAEVPRLHQQLREQGQSHSDQLKQLQEQVSRLQQPKPEDPKPVDTAKDEEEFGSDLVGMVKRVVGVVNSNTDMRLRSIEAAVAKLNKLADRVDTIQQDQVVSAEEAFYSQLTRAVPDWETINADPRWIAWLNEPHDVLVDEPRQALLDKAHAALKVERVVRFFEEFKKTLPKPQPTGQERLSSQVTPQKSTGAATAQPAERFWTLAEYNNAFDPRLRGKIGEQEAMKLQAEADRALAEGRVKV